MLLEQFRVSLFYRYGCFMNESDALGASNASRDLDHFKIALEMFDPDNA